MLSEDVLALFHCVVSASLGNTNLPKWSSPMNEITYLLL